MVNMPATCPALHCKRPPTFWGGSVHNRVSTPHRVHALRSTELAACGPSATTKRSVKGSKPARQTSSSKSSAPQSTKGLKSTRGYRQAPSQKLQGRTGPGGGLSRVYIQFTGFPFPLGPLLFRQTYRYEVVPGSMWTFEQMQTLGLSSVATTVRMTVIKLASGGLWIHSPIAPTRECVALINELEAPVEYIILPTYAYEHKVFVAPMSRKYPQAKACCWIPDTLDDSMTRWQWTVPLQLPPQLLGIFAQGTLQDNDTQAPWSAEIEQKVFECSIGLKPYTEVAFLHKASKTLLVTDALIHISPEPPEVIKDGDLYAAGGPLPLPVLAVCNGGEYLNRLTNPPSPEDPDERRMLGWKRNALQVNYFAPWDLLQPDPSFLSMVNRVLVPPILQTLVFSAAPEETQRWVDDIVSDWDFTSVIPCHFAGPVPSSPQAVKTAFGFAFEGAERAAPAKAGGLLGFLGSLFRAAPVNAAPQLPLHDFRALLGIQNILKRTKVLNSTPLNQGRPE